MGLKDQAKQTTEVKVKEELEEKRVICGKRGALVSPFAEICPKCGGEFNSYQ